MYGCSDPGIMYGFTLLSDHAWEITLSEDWLEKRKLESAPNCFIRCNASEYVFGVFAKIKGDRLVISNKEKKRVEKAAAELKRPCEFRLVVTGDCDSPHTEWNPDSDDKNEVALYYDGEKDEEQGPRKKQKRKKLK